MRGKAIDFYMRGMTKKDALLKAGYSESVASTDAKSVFDREDVREEIARRQKNLAKKANVDADWIVRQLKAIAEAEVSDLLEIDAEGVVTQDFRNLTPELRKAISGFSIKSYKKGRGQYAIPVTEIKITSSDKLRAIDMLARHLDFYNDSVKIEGEVSLVDRIYEGRSRASRDSSSEDSTHP